MIPKTKYPTASKNRGECFSTLYMVAFHGTHLALETVIAPSCNFAVPSSLRQSVQQRQLETTSSTVRANFGGTQDQRNVGLRGLGVRITQPIGEFGLKKKTSRFLAQMPPQTAQLPSWGKVLMGESSVSRKKTSFPLLF